MLILGESVESVLPNPHELTVRKVWFVPWQIRVLSPKKVEEMLGRPKQHPSTTAHLSAHSSLCLCLWKLASPDTDLYGRRHGCQQILIPLGLTLSIASPKDLREGLVPVICCCIMNDPKTEGLKRAATFIISRSFCGSGIQGQLSGVVMAQSLSYARNHVKARLGLQNPFPK